MKQVKLIIANTETNTVYFNYGDDYSDITRVLVEDHSPWEEVEDDDLYELEEFVSNFNLPKNKNKNPKRIFKNKKNLPNLMGCEDRRAFFVSSHQ